MDFIEHPEFVRELLRAGARIYLYRSRVLHAKAILLDDFFILARQLDAEPMVNVSGSNRMSVGLSPCSPTARL